jgi:hypothetical protein
MKAATVAGQFIVDGQLASIRPTGSGNVNDTYLAVFRTHFSEERIIIQRINGHVFSRPEWIMENMRILTNHCHGQLLEESGSADRIWQLPKVIPCRDGKDYYLDEDGNFWRALTLIASATSFDKPQGTEHAYEVGTVLSQFHRLTASLDPTLLRDTLPGFHVTPGYLAAYDEVIQGEQAQALANSSIEVRNLQRFVEDRRPFCRVLEDARQSGELSMRVIHGDPKIGNVMLDNDTGKGTAIIDLDTTKPGLIHYDFGDALRSICNKEGEETDDLSKIVFDLELCEAFVRGYMVHARDMLTDNDTCFLYDSIRLISFELGLRFFQDYLAGNLYFKVSSPEQNLRRAMVQFRLCESIELREKQIRKVLDSAAK